jgi:serine/threonine protein kinase
MVQTYPRQLSFGANNYVVALGDKEAAKIFPGDTRSDIGSEAEKMKFANTINSLVVKFIRLDYDETNKWDLLVIERLFAFDYRSEEIEKRELQLEVFEAELKALHEAGFVHRHLNRQPDLRGDKFDNILLTTNGLRLIDVGISALRTQVGDKLFDKYVEVELEELKVFKEFFLNR